MEKVNGGHDASDNSNDNYRQISQKVEDGKSRRKNF